MTDPQCAIVIGTAIKVGAIAYGVLFTLGALATVRAWRRDVARERARFDRRRARVAQSIDETVGAPARDPRP